MSYEHIRRAKARERDNKKKILEVNSNVNDRSGIYVLTRKDENGIRYAYIGQAKHVLSRLAQHLSGYQHIDLSIKKHGLWSIENEFGWMIGFKNFPEDQLDEKEQLYIKYYAYSGYQLRNKTAGGQGEGKAKIDEYRPAKGYHDGIKQGKKMLARQLKHIIETHLEVGLRVDKRNNKVSQKAFEKFRELLDESNY